MAVAVQGVYGADNAGVKRGKVKAAGYMSAPAWSGDGSLVAFEYRAGGDSAVFVVRADGSGLKNVTGFNGTNRRPLWKPGTAEIFFESDRKGTFDIYLQSVSGGSARQITGGAGDEGNLALSVTGDYAYCEYEAGTGRMKVMLKKGQGGEAVRIYDGQEACYPSFSADGKLVAFSTGEDIWTYEIKTGKKKNITEKLLETGYIKDGFPVWGPKGKRLAFVARYEGYQNELYTIGADGKKVRRISENLVGDFLPVWTPDGKSILYSGFHGKDMPDLFLASSEAPASKRLTALKGSEIFPALSGDGGFVVFVHRTGREDVLVKMDMKSGNLLEITSSRKVAQTNTK